MVSGGYTPRSTAGTVLQQIVRTHVERFLTETASATDGVGVSRLGANPDAPWVERARPLQARCDGFDLHAGVAVAGEDRARLEQLCRYLLRPPIAQERLALQPDGTILAALAGSGGATVQLLGSDAPACLSVTLPTVLHDEGDRFKARL